MAGRSRDFDRIAEDAWRRLHRLWRIGTIMATLPLLGLTARFGPVSFIVWSAIVAALLLEPWVSAIRDRTDREP